MWRLVMTIALLVSAGLGVSGANAVTCQPIRYDSNRYTICEVDPTREDLRLFLRDADGAPYGFFTSIDTALAAKGNRLAFAMNAGMYHEDRSPVGHYVEAGKQVMRVIPNAGPGNFGLVPNGVLCITERRARVIETHEYLASRPACRFATQSGPMLVIDGALHPKFKASSTSRFIRNGVGSSEDGKRLVFAISDNTVTFHEFARLFRDGLRLPQALFLDGSISRLHAPELGRSDLGRALGPIIGVVEPLAGPAAN